MKSFLLLTLALLLHSYVSYGQSFENYCLGCQIDKSASMQSEMLGQAGTLNIIANEDGRINEISFQFEKNFTAKEYLRLRESLSKKFRIKLEECCSNFKGSYEYRLKKRSIHYYLSRDQKGLLILKPSITLRSTPYPLEGKAAIYENIE